jgi:hypothetical protein
MILPAVSLNFTNTNLNSVVRNTVEAIIVYSASMDEYVLETTADLMDIGITRARVIIEEEAVLKPQSSSNRPSNQTREDETNSILYHISEINEKCALEACVKVGLHFKVDAGSLFLKAAVQKLQQSVTGICTRPNSSERGKPFEELCVGTLITSETVQDKPLSQFPLFQKAVVEVRRGTGFLEKIVWKVKTAGRVEILYGDSMLEYFKKVITALNDNDRVAMKKLTDVAISPDENFHADLAVLHMLNEHDVDAPIELALELWSFKFDVCVDMKKSVMSTALDRAYVNNYAKSKYMKRPGLNEKSYDEQKGIFDGVVAFVKLEDVTQKGNIEQSIIEKGGKIQKGVGKQVTHIIVSKDLVDSVSKKKEDKWLLMPSWVEDSVKNAKREEESAYECEDENEDKTTDSKVSETVTEFQNLVLKNKLISHLLRVHVHATAHHTNFDLRDEPTADVNHPENEMLLFVDLKDLGSLIDEHSMNLIKMVTLHQNKNRFSDSR